MAMSVREIRMTEAEFDLAREKIAKLQKRIAKRGWTGTLDITGEIEQVTEINPIGLPVTRQMVKATIEGSPPKYEGWTFLAKLEWDKDSGLVVYNAPGTTEQVDRSKLREGACDHCGINRYRRYIYVVADEQGKQLQVGSTCLKDFLGWNTNPVWVGEDVVDKAFGDGNYGVVEPTYSVESVLAVAWAVIQRYGYIRSSDSAQPTKVTVAEFLGVFRLTLEVRRMIAEVQPYVSDSVPMAKRIREWVLSDEFSGDNDYVLNLKNIARGEFVRYRNFGFLVSAPQAWAKYQERSLIRKHEKSEILSEWNGKVGDKLELDVTLINMQSIDSYWGVTTLYTFKGSDNRIYKWFSSKVIWDSVTDEPLRIKGTVKKLDEFKGVKSTVLTRVKQV